MVIYFGAVVILCKDGVMVAPSTDLIPVNITRGMESDKKPVRLLDTMISRLRKVHRTEHDIAMDLFDTTFIEDMDDELWVEKNAIRARLMKCIEETDSIREELWKLRMKIEYPHRRD